ncbi:MAG: hypothetical protein JJ957_19170 [Pseudomonadales bacterium]|nr:hypothetical protein [Pseudomonadales bacterium]MBO6597616.1 hypothetical protein [Pseudomonadales bacterium]MBO6824334.1 hypothetical protein [Pseudomonadales bacterium]
MKWWFTKKKERQIRIPQGIFFQIDINIDTLDEIAKKLTPPSSEETAKSWLYCTKVQIGIVAINGIQNNIIVMPGKEGAVYNEFEFEVSFPFRVARQDTQTLRLEYYNEFVLLSFMDVPVICIPSALIVSALRGEPLASYGNSITDMTGRESVQRIKIADHELPSILRVAKEWFSCKNTALDVRVTRVSAASFPLELGPATKHPSFF